MNHQLLKMKPTNNPTIKRRNAVKSYKPKESLSIGMSYFDMSANLIAGGKTFTMLAKYCDGLFWCGVGRINGTGELIDFSISASSDFVPIGNAIPPPPCAVKK